MKRFWISSLVILILFFANCGSGRKLVKNPQPLGFVPFACSNMAGPADELNQRLEITFRNSGSFFLHVLDTMPNIWDLSRMKSVHDSLLQWILTGEFVYEDVFTDKGLNVPFVAYRPATVLRVKLVYRLYNREKDAWQEMGEIEVRRKFAGKIQIIDYDSADPSLIMDSKQRQILRQQAYLELAEQLIKKLQKKMKIK